jgi:hypothetical protein
MYILVPDRFIYLCSPRTGSRTTREALEKHCGAVRVGEMHHAKRTELEQMKQDLPDLPVYSMMRDPFDFVCSAYARAYDPTMRDFLDNWNSDVLEEWDGAMTPYEGFVDHYFIFENTLEDFFRRVGFPDLPLEHKGRYETPPYKPLAEGDEQMVREQFPQDFARYEHWKQRNAVL